MSDRPYTLSGDSSVGRAIDCRSIGRVFNSPSPDLFKGLNCPSIAEKVFFTRSDSSINKKIYFIYR